MILLTLGGIVVGVSGCGGIIGPTVLVGDLSLDPGETGTLLVQVFHLAGLQVMQVGPQGALVFDPEVIHVEGLEGVSGFQVFAHGIDNEEGKVLFLIGFPGGALTDGTVLQLRVRAVGRRGARTTVEFTQIDLLTDRQGNPLPGVKLLGGRVTIGKPFSIDLF